MANHDPEHRHEYRDALTLKAAIRESILTSPGSFLRTVADVDTMSHDDWRKEIDTSTWVVIQRNDEVVGIAVARWPDKELDYDVDQRSARFIESVWVAPKFRGFHLSERLVNYLMEVESKKYPNVKNFMLWVFEENVGAARVYRRMQFKNVGKQALQGSRTEVRYEYALPNLGTKKAARRWMANAAAREGDWRQHGVTYRVLGRHTL